MKHSETLTLFMSKIRFKRKTKREIALAAGELTEEFQSLSIIEKCAFATQPQVPPNLFQPIPIPRSGDWLSCRKELGQTYKSFARRSFRHGPHGHCNCLEVVPIGIFEKGQSPPLEELKIFMEAYYQGVKVRFVKPVKISEVAKTGCLTEDDQLLVPDAMSFLRHRRAPRDVFAQIAITMVDITPGDGWNFVFGQASMSDGIGIFSFARYGTCINTLLKKSCKTMAHEVGHIFGLRHCIYFQCILNGNNGDEYAPLTCCPICLRKLSDACGNFDIIQRYRTLANFYDRHGWKEFEFVTKRIEKIKEKIKESNKSKDLHNDNTSKSSSNDSDSNSNRNRGESKHIARTVHRSKRRVGAIVQLGEMEVLKEMDEWNKKGKEQGKEKDSNNFKTVKVLAPRGIIIRESSKINSKKVKTVRSGALLQIPLPINTLRTKSGTLRVETTCGWTTSISNRGMVLLNI